MIIKLTVIITPSNIIHQKVKKKYSDIMNKNYREVIRKKSSERNDKRRETILR